MASAVRQRRHALWHDRRGHRPPPPARERHDPDRDPASAGEKLRRHYGPPAPAQGEVWADVALPWASSEFYAATPLVLAMLARSNPSPVPVLGANDREWTAPWGALPHRHRRQRSDHGPCGRMARSAGRSGARHPERVPGEFPLRRDQQSAAPRTGGAATLTAIRLSSFTTVRIVPKAPIEGEWTQGCDHDPDELVNHFREIAVPGRAVASCDAKSRAKRRAAGPADASVVIRHQGREQIELILEQGTGVDTRAIKDKLTPDWRHLVPQTGPVRTRCRIAPSELIRQVEAARKGPASAARDEAAIRIGPTGIHMLTEDEARSADAIRVRRTWLDGVAQAAAARPGRLRGELRRTRDDVRSREGPDRLDHHARKAPRRYRRLNNSRTGRGRSALCRA